MAVRRALILEWQTRLAHARRMRESESPDAWGLWLIHERILTYLLTRYGAQVGGDTLPDPAPASPAATADSAFWVRPADKHGRPPRSGRQLAGVLTDIQQENQDRYTRLEKPPPHVMRDPALAQLLQAVAASFFRHQQSLAQQRRRRDDQTSRALKQVYRALCSQTPDLEEVSRILDQMCARPEPAASQAESVNESHHSPPD
jgi:hypothetical protein